MAEHRDDSIKVIAECKNGKDRQSAASHVTFQASVSSDLLPFRMVPLFKHLAMEHNCLTMKLRHCMPRR